MLSRSTPTADASQGLSFLLLTVTLLVQDMNGFPFPPKSLFLTVTATRIEGGAVNQVTPLLCLLYHSLVLTSLSSLSLSLCPQLYRVDVPMKDVALDREGYQRHLQEQDLLRHSRPPTTARHDHSSSSSSLLASSSSSAASASAASGVAYYEVIEEMSRLLEGEDPTINTSNGNSNGNSSGRGSGRGNGNGITKLKIYPPKPMILFPALPANVRIFFTVSEVTEWPRAKFIGQCSVQGDNWLIWRQVATMSQVYLCSSSLSPHVSLPSPSLPSVSDLISHLSLGTHRSV
jgi:hypothetical protein